MKVHKRRKTATMKSTAHYERPIYNIFSRVIGLNLTEPGAPCAQLQIKKKKGLGSTERCEKSG